MVESQLWVDMVLGMNNDDNNNNSNNNDNNNKLRTIILQFADNMKMGHRGLTD